MTTARSLCPVLSRGASRLFAAILLVGCAPDTPTAVPDPATGQGPAADAPDDKIGRFARWRAQPPAPVAVTCHGFFTASWFHPDGLMHYFVSELVTFDIAPADAAKFATCEATQRHLAMFQTRVRELVAKWPQGPEVDEQFGERHVTLDSDQGEAQLQAFLDHRRSDKVRVHRLWLH